MAISATIGGALVVLFSVGLREIIPASALEHPADAPPSAIPIQYTQQSGNCNQGGPNYGPINNNCNNTYNLTPPERHMNPELSNNILSKLPRDKKISVDCPLGDAEACLFAKEILVFLVEKGFQTDGPNVSQTVRMSPLKGLAFNPDTAEFSVGSR